MTWRWLNHDRVVLPIDHTDVACNQHLAKNRLVLQLLVLSRREPLRTFRPQVTDMDLVCYRFAGSKQLVPIGRQCDRDKTRGGPEPPPRGNVVAPIMAISVIGLPKESEARMAEPDNAASEPRIRSATVVDVRAVAQIVEDAYCVYVPRMGKPPGPMLDDYSARVTEGVVWVVEEGTTVVGILVLLPKPDHLLLDNIAVARARQGLGFGRRLLAFAEAEAMRRGYREIHLYTHETMTENQRLYAAIGYEETGRGTEAGYERVFMRKQLGA